MEAVITLLFTSFLTIGRIHWLFRRSSKKFKKLVEMVQKIELPPRRRTIEVMANPPFPGTLRIDVHPAEDIPGEWIADIQPVDIITQGRDMVHAIEAAAEAVQMCWEDDQANGLDFWERGAVWRAQQCEEDCEPLITAGVAYGIPFDEEREEDGKFDVILVDTSCRLKTMKLLKDRTGKPLSEIKEAVDHCPLLLISVWGKKQAESFADTFRETGATVEVQVSTYRRTPIPFLVTCTPESPCLDTVGCPRCRTFPSGSGG